MARAYMCASHRPVAIVSVQLLELGHEKRCERTVTSVMNGTGMPAEGGVDPGRPLKWNDRRLVLVLPTSLATRNAALWQFIVEGRFVACDRKVGLTLMLSQAVGEPLIAYRERRAQTRLGVKRSADIWQLSLGEPSGYFEQ